MRKNNYNDEMGIREKHYQTYLGKMDERIMHSTDENEAVHIDIYQFPPTPQKAYWTLLTGGMSEIRQNIPNGAGWMSGRTEIFMYVEEPQDWMFRLLKGTALMPFKNRTFLHWEHTYSPNNNVLAEKSNFSSLLFTLPFFEDRNFDTLCINGNKIDFLWMIPVTERELNSDSQSLIEMIIQTKNPRIFPKI